MKIFLLIKKYSPVFLVSVFLKEIYRKVYLEKILGSNSQNKEDLLIEKINVKKDGFYIDIGAYNPTRLSNTYRFYKKGWSGVTIEPNPEVLEIFKKIRPGDRFLNIGIAKKTDTINYYPFLIPALSTFSKKQSDEKEGEGHTRLPTKKIQVISVDKFLESISSKIDLLSLDVEGMDLDILKSWDWKNKSPTIICVENENKQILRYLEKKGYVLRFETRDNFILSLHK